MEHFVKNHPAGTFFQSRLFGEFQEAIPYRGKTWVIKGAVGEASCLVVRMRLPLGKCWLWMPYGPPGFTEEIFKEFGRIAEKENAIYARIEPPIHWDMTLTEELKKKWRITKSPKRFTPEHTLILDLTKSEGEILAQMKPKGRYNIQVAKRHGVRVQMFPNFLSVPAGDFSAFYEILRGTSERDAFGIHPKFFYEKLLEIFGAHHSAALFLAYDKDDTVAAGIIVVFYKDTATYYYGGSRYSTRQLMAPYLLQWEAILEAKKRGMIQYDFLGIAPPGAKNHPWAGVTEFKKKFGGKELSFPPAFDIIYRPFWYALMSLKEKFS